MGLITIETKGSFGDKGITISAQEHGHAHAVNKAIIWLNDLMRESINSDHKLQEEGCKPDKGFTVK